MITNNDFLICIGELYMQLRMQQEQNRGLQQNFLKAQELNKELQERLNLWTDDEELKSPGPELVSPRKEMAV